MWQEISRSTTATSATGPESRLATTSRSGRSTPKALGASASFNTSVTAYIGQVQVTGSMYGNDVCGTVDSGRLTLSVSTPTPHWSVTSGYASCSSLTGNYVRVGVAMVMVASGLCYVNYYPVNVQLFGTWVDHGLGPPALGFDGPFAFSTGGTS
jgi:hypothetical protein